MNASSIIVRIRATGGEIALTKEGIKLKVPASLRDEAVAEIAAHKEAIKLELKSDLGDIWDANDYRAFFDERAGITEFDGGLTRGQAEAKAFESCVVEWLNQHPERSYPGICASCSRPEQNNAPVIPFGIRAHAHTWLHPECWHGWQQQRRTEAIASLADLGIAAPVSPPKDQTVHLQEGNIMNNNERFILNEEEEITDLLNPSMPPVWHPDGDPEDQISMREEVLRVRLRDLVGDLFIDRREQRTVQFELGWAISEIICASHFVAISSVPSIHAKFGGKFIREKRGLEDSTSLSHFCDDVCSLLLDLYGDGESDALEKLRSAVLCITFGLTRHEGKDLWHEHDAARDVDFELHAIGRPKCYGVITGSDWRRGMAALDALRARARKVRETPSAFSKYSVAFAKDWKIEPDQSDQAQDDGTF
jgi:hypothetical protein